MSRRARVERRTGETSVRVELDLDGTGRRDVRTPIGFLTHMLEQLARHALFDLTVQAEGDVHVDGHHTTEDVGLLVGTAVARALGDRAGIRRFGHAIIPMDDALATCAIDLSGRPHLVWRVPVPGTRLGGFDTELAEVFFDAFARGAQCNVHCHLHCGHVAHHVVEVCFKALARALRSAVERDERAPDVPSTKGTLDA
ncbi:MAG: imidazoleglycerol-phosphate dehydratase HisB [Myxococcota bacterium]|nr:imidazoleglycerol-phosphate dehydratase HisB [Myxococcota bacterium]MDW8360869.1 imidazoleglycerol-phosphate dehydratase HisB [Myxococcales bacterium]